MYLDLRRFRNVSRTILCTLRRGAMVRSCVRLCWQGSTFQRGPLMDKIMHRPIPPVPPVFNVVWRKQPRCRVRAPTRKAVRTLPAEAGRRNDTTTKTNAVSLAILKVGLKGYRLSSCATRVPMNFHRVVCAPGRLRNEAVHIFVHQPLVDDVIF